MAQRDRAVSVGGGESARADGDADALGSRVGIEISM
jgi:hypothetical protein